MLVQIRDNPVFETLFFAGYFALKKITCKDSRSVLGSIKKADFRIAAKQEKALKEYHIAIISDELTYENFSKECHVHVLTPNNWKQVFQENEIDLFLCESAWNGCKEYDKCWRGRIYKNHKVLFETRKVLFRILNYCEKNEIPTVFWNKEDPTFFGNEKYDFVDTALYFQYIFTTAEECIEMYQKKGHKDVHLMMFGFSPELYNPLQSGKKQKKAIFAGSWFGEDEQRCKAEDALFRKVLEDKIPLVIYNRQSDSNSKKRKFPEVFQQYIHSAISQKQLGKELKGSRYAININTVTDSETMFARRVYELMASNVYIISNQSKAMKRQLAGRYSSIEDKIPEDVIAICRDNVDYVFQNHTNQIRLTEMLQTIGFRVIKPRVLIAVCIDTVSNETFVCGNGVEYEFVNSLEDVSDKHQYFMLWDGKTEVSVEKMIPHFSYLNEMCGIRISRENLYQVLGDTDNKNVLFPIELLEMIQTNSKVSLKKYYI